MKPGLHTSGDGLAGLKAGLKTLRHSQAYVGIPEAKGPRKKGVISNAQLLFIHTNGSPKMKIPARAVIEPAIENKSTADRINKSLGLAAQAGLAGDKEALFTALDRAGTIAESASKRWFTDPANGWPPNKRRTVLRKLRTLKGSDYDDARALVGTDRQDEVDTPLIRTGQMRRAITHVTEIE